MSRQTGAGGRSVADCLKTLLDQEYPHSCEWTVFDKNLVHKAMEEHGLPERFAQYLPDDKVSELRALMGELTGLHPNLWELNHKVSETILHLAMMGGSIVMGRGANFVTRHFKQGFHVRLIGSYRKRVNRAAHFYGLSERLAETFVKKEDGARKRFVSESFDAEIDDPLAYDLVINTDRMDYEMAAGLILKGIQLHRNQLYEKQAREEHSSMRMVLDRVPL